MSRTTGQHVLPRFFLNGFAFRKRKKEAYVYLFRKGQASSIVSNTRKAGKQRLYYGEPSDSGVESTLEQLETRCAPNIAAIKDTRQLHESQLDDVLMLVANLTLRSHQLRVGFASEAERLVAVVRNAFTGEDAQKFLKRHMRKQRGMVNAEIGKMIRALPHLPREPAVHVALREYCEDYIDSAIDDGQFTGNARELFRAIEGLLDFDELTEVAHIKALGETVAPAKWLNQLHALQWEVMGSGDVPLIVGDVGPLGNVGGDGLLRPLSTLGGKANVVLLPLSADLLLVGHAPDQQPMVDFEEVNCATARCSAEYFVSSFDSDREQQLLARIGVGSQLLTDDEFRDITREFTDEDPVNPVGSGLSARIDFVVESDGDTDLCSRAVDELNRIMPSFHWVARTLGVNSAGQFRLLVTDDLPRSEVRLAKDYGLDTAPDYRERVVPVWSKTLYSNYDSSTRATVILHCDLWDNDNADLVICRHQLVYAQLVRAFVVKRHSCEASAEGGDFANSLESLATELLEIYDANRIAAAVTGALLEPNDGQGHSMTVGDILGLAYVDSGTELLNRLAVAARDVVQRYRETADGLDQILPAICPIVYDMFIVLAYAKGLSDTTVPDQVVKAFKNAPGFEEYLADDFELLWAAFDEPDWQLSEQQLVRVVRRVLARVGVYVDELDNGDLDLIIGAPRLALS